MGKTKEGLQMNIRIISRNEPTEGIVSRLFNVAKKGLFNGKEETVPYLELCRWFVERIDAIVIMTRDEGYHSCGWWKNPDYERCYHVSISYPGGTNFKKTEWLLAQLFGTARRLMWCEPPYSKEGKSADVYHYRLFCDKDWNPIMPRGEVYNTQFTERGWKSFSELHGI